MNILPVSHACGAHPRYQPGEDAGRMLWRYKGMRAAGGKLSPGLFLLLHFICNQIPDGITPGIKQNPSRTQWSHLSWSGVIFSLPNQNPRQSFSLPRTLQPCPLLPHPPQRICLPCVETPSFCPQEQTGPRLCPPYVGDRAENKTWERGGERTGNLKST